MLQEPRTAPPGWVLTIYYSVHRPDGSPECHRHVCISVQQKSDVECNEVQENSLWALLMRIQRMTWCFATFAFAANFICWELSEMWNGEGFRTIDHQVYCGWQPNHLTKKKVCCHAIGDTAVVKCISLQNQTNCSNALLHNESPFGEPGPHGDLFGDLGPLFILWVSPFNFRTEGRKE